MDRGYSPNSHGFDENQERNPEQADEELSAAAADEFAARIRPSWAPSLAPPHAIASPVAPPPAPQEVREGEAEARIWLQQAQHRRRAATCGVVAMCVLVCGLATWSMANDNQPPSTSSATRVALSQAPAPPQSSLSAATTAPQGAARGPAGSALNTEVEHGSANGPPLLAHSTDVAVVAEGDGELVDLRISTSPEGARVELNGRQVANPFSGTVARDRNVEVQVSAPGYQPENVTVYTDRGRVIGIALKPR